MEVRILFAIGALRDLYSRVFSRDGTDRRDSSIDALELNATQGGGLDGGYNNPVYDSFIAASSSLLSSFGAHSESAFSGSGMFCK